MRCLYILEINPLLVNLFVKIFSHSVGHLFSFLFVFVLTIAVKNILIRYHLLIFVFIFIIVGSGSEKILPLFMSESVLPIFSSKSFRVSGLMFNSLTNFEFIFVYDVRDCSNFIPLKVAVQFSQHHLLKRMSILHCICLLPLSD